MDIGYFYKYLVHFLAFSDEYITIYNLYYLYIYRLLIYYMM
jgi:hypothetical protein